MIYSAFSGSTIPFSKHPHPLKGRLCIASYKNLGHHDEEEQEHVLTKGR